MKEDWLKLWAWVYEKALAALTQPVSGVGIVTTVGSMYSVEGERMADMERLRTLCDEAVLNPAFAPKDGKTFCNFAARFIAEGTGFFGLPVNTLANDLIVILATHPEVQEDSIERAHAHAIRGGLAFLALEEYPHGHIPVVYPAPMEMSGTWGGLVPMLANVGRENGIMKASAVYRLEKRPLLRAFLVGVTA